MTIAKMIPADATRNAGTTTATTGNAATAIGPKGHVKCWRAVIIKCRIFALSSIYDYCRQMILYVSMHILCWVATIKLCRGDKKYSVAGWLLPKAIQSIKTFIVEISLLHAHQKELGFHQYWYWYRYRCSEDVSRVGIQTIIEMNCHIKWVQHACFPRVTDCQVSEEWELACSISPRNELHVVRSSWQLPKCWRGEICIIWPPQIPSLNVCVSVSA